MSRRPNIIVRKEYRELDVLIKDFREQILEPSEDRCEVLFYFAVEVGRFCDTLMYNPTQLTQVIETVKLLRTSSSPGLVPAEKRLMDGLWWVAYNCANVLQPEAPK